MRLSSFNRYRILCVMFACNDNKLYYNQASSTNDEELEAKWTKQNTLH